MFRFIRNLFSPAPDTITPEQAARIAAQRDRNIADFSDGAEVGARLGMNSGQINQSVLAYRQLRNKGLWAGSLEDYMQHRIDTGITRVETP